MTITNSMEVKKEPEDFRKLAADQIKSMPLKSPYSKTVRWWFSALYEKSEENRIRYYERFGIGILLNEKKTSFFNFE